MFKKSLKNVTPIVNIIVNYNLFESLTHGLERGFTCTLAPK